jgi:hypothetical protein
VGTETFPDPIQRGMTSLSPAMHGIAHSSWTHVLLVHDIDAGQNLTIDDDDALYQNDYRARHVYVSTLHQTLLSRIKQLKLIRSENGSSLQRS